MFSTYESVFSMACVPSPMCCGGYLILDNFDTYL